MIDPLLFLSINLISYIVIHYPLDLYMLITRDRTIELKDYGIKESNAVNALLGVSSLIMWLSWYAMVILQKMPESLRLAQPDSMQIVGIIFITLAVFIAIWARILRGKHSASWGLNETIPLVTSGPYSLIRHPTYTFYLLMFMGLPLLTGIWPLYVLIPGFYGYVKTVKSEEDLLIAHFGEEYEEYQKITKKFIPFIW